MNWNLLEDNALIPRSIRERLRYCEIESDRLTLDRFPDFLIVGPQRTGTTWLHAVLGSHPEVFLTEPKELFFFSRLRQRSSPRFESALLDWYLAHFRDPWPRWLGKQARSFARLGRAYRPKVRGEATASYAAMDPELIREIAVLRPDVKVLMMVRHPVERAWSHAKKDLTRNRGRRPEDVGDEEWKAFFADDYQRRCARYEENLANWRACFGAANVFVGTFEQVEQQPAELLARVTRFLGVSGDARLVDPALLASVVNPTGASGVPERFRLFLEDMFAQEILGWRRVADAAAVGATSRSGSSGA
ncbi:MAG: sulfotransferase [Candidatus Binatia bacterium]